jgi:hypothetical protein
MDKQQFETELVTYEALEKELINAWKKTKEAFMSSPHPRMSPTPTLTELKVRKEYLNGVYKDVRKTLKMSYSECEGNVPSTR